MSVSSGIELSHENCAPSGVESSHENCALSGVESSHEKNSGPSGIESFHDEHNGPSGMESSHEEHRGCSNGCSDVPVNGDSDVKPASPVPGTSKSSGVRRRTSKESKRSSPHHDEGHLVFVTLMHNKCVVHNIVNRC